MTSETAGSLAVMGLAVTGQLLLEAALPSRSVPNIYLLTLIYLCHNRGRLWRVDGAFWSGLLLGAMLRQPPGAYSLAALLAMFLSSAVRGSLARRSSLGMLLEVAAASVAFDLVTVLLLGRPVLASLPAYLLPVAWRAVLTSAAFLAIWLLFGLTRLIPRAPVRR